MCEFSSASYGDGERSHDFKLINSIYCKILAK